MSWLRRRFYRQPPERPAGEPCPFSREAVTERPGQICDLCGAGPDEHWTRAQWRAYIEEIADADA